MENGNIVSSKMVLRIDQEGKGEHFKNVSFNRVASGASNKDMLEAGRAIAGLQSYALGGVRRIDTVDLTD